MKILILDDSNQTLELLSLHVTKFGYEVIRTRNSKEALSLAEAESPDLIFVDLGVPDVDRVKTTAILKQNPKTAHIPVVAVTAWTSELWREKALKVGMVDYRLKPVAPQPLKQIIEQFANRSLDTTDRGRLQVEKETELEHCGRPDGLKALNRLRTCLTKLKRPSRGCQRVEAFFTLYPRDR